MGLYLVSFRHAYGLLRFTSLILRTQICPSKLNVNVTLEKPLNSNSPCGHPLLAPPGGVHQDFQATQ